MFILEGEHLVLKAADSKSSEKLLGGIPEHKAGECLCGLAVTTKTNMYSKDIFTDLRCTRNECKAAGLKSFAGLPLFNGDEVIGVLGMSSRKERDFELESNFLEMISKTLAIGINKSILCSQTKQAEEKLRFKQNRLEEAERIGQLGNWSYDVVSGKIEWSQEMYNIYGRNPEKDPLTYENLISWIHEDDREKHNAYFQRMNEAKPVEQFKDLEYRMITRQGTTEWVNVKFETRFDEKGKPALFFGTALRITDQKNAEYRIQESEANLSALINNTDDTIWSLDRDYNYIAYNNNAAAVFKAAYGFELTKGINAKEHMPKEEYDFWMPKIEACLAGTKDEFEFPYEFDGQTSYFQSSINPIYEGESITGVAIRTSNITERKKAEERIKESETRLRLAQIAGQIGIWSVDLRTGEQYLSEVAAGFHGLPEGTYAREDMFGMVPEEDLPALNRAFEKAVNEGLPFDVEHRIINKKTGKRTLIHARGKSTFNADGEAILLQGTALDITERKKAELALKESEEKFSKIFNSSPIAIFLIDPVSRNFLDSNKAFTKLVGYTKKEVIGQNIDELKMIVDYNKDDELKAQLKDEGSVDSSIVKFRKKDGNVGWAIGSGEIIKLKGRPVILSMLINITERKKAEEELQLSEERLNRAQHIAKMGDYSWDVDTGEVTWSDSLFDLLKYDKNEVIDYAKVNAEIHHPEDLERVTQWLNEAVASGKDELPANEYRIIRKDGETIYIRTEGVFERSDGKTKLFATLYDITEQKDAEKEIINKNKSLATLLDVSYKITASLNKEIVLQEIINNSVKLTNLDTGAIYSIEGNRLYLNAVMPALPPDFPDEFRLANLDDHPHIRLSAKTGEPILIPDVDKETLSPAEQTIVEARKMKSLLYIPLLFEKRTIGVLILATQNSIRLFTEYEIDLYRTFAGQAALVIKNIELFKKVENSVEQLEQRVLERTAELQNANRELEEFAYSISHDLRAPLRSISGFSEIISHRYKDSLNDEAKQYFGFILEASKNMSNLIDDLLRFARLAKKDIQKIPIDLGEIINNVLKDLHQDIRNQKAVINLPEEFPVVYGDKSLLIQVFSNLLINALKYHKPDTQSVINITVVEESEKMVVRIQDNGIGIAKEYHHKIFEIFQRLHTQDEYQGTGIGLAIVKKAVNAIGGSIRLESEVGNGSTFILIFEKQLK